MIIGMSTETEVCHDPWTGFTIYAIERNSPKGYMWSGRRLTKNQTTSEDDFGYVANMPHSTNRKQKLQPERGNLSPSQTSEKKQCNTQNSQRRLESSYVDFLSNAKYSHEEARLCIFEDNEAVIKMIMNGRSPNLRHVSRTHQVALDWLFDRI